MGADEVIDSLVAFLSNYSIGELHIVVTDNRDLIKNTFYFDSNGDL